MLMNHLSEIKNNVIKFLYRVSGWKLLEKSGNIFVLEDENRIVMKHGYSTTYSIFNKRSLYTHSYFDYFLPLAYLYRRPKILVIGMGGGTIPMQFKTLFGSKMDLEVVDIDKTVMALAKKHFLKGKNIKTIVEDGARYVSKKENEYDLVILDAFEGLKIPQQFLKRRFIRNAHAALNRSGILGINVDMSDMRTKGYVKLLEEQFKVYKLMPSLTATNLILVCSKRFDKTYIANAVNKHIKKTGENEFLLGRYNNL